MKMSRYSGSDAFAGCLVVIGVLILGAAISFGLGWLFGACIEWIFFDETVYVYKGIDLATTFGIVAMFLSFFGSSGRSSS